MLSDAPGARTPSLRRWPGADLLRCVALPPRRLNGVHVRLRPSHIPRPHRAVGPESQGHLRWCNREPYFKVTCFIILAHLDVFLLAVLCCVFRSRWFWNKSLRRVRCSCLHKTSHDKSIQIQPVRRLYKHVSAHVVCRCFTLKFTISKAPSKPGTSAHQTLRTCADASATSVLHNEISESSSWSAPSAMSWPASRGHGSKFWSRPRISKNIIMEVWWSMAIRAISFASNHKNTIRQLQMRQLQTTNYIRITV